MEEINKEFQNRKGPTLKNNQDEGPILKMNQDNEEKIVGENDNLNAKQPLKDVDKDALQ